MRDGLFHLPHRIPQILVLSGQPGVIRLLPFQIGAQRSVLTLQVVVFLLYLLHHLAEFGDLDGQVPAGVHLDLQRALQVGQFPLVALRDSFGAAQVVAKAAATVPKSCRSFPAGRGLAAQPADLGLLALGFRFQLPVLGLGLCDLPAEVLVSILEVLDVAHRVLVGRQARSHIFQDRVPVRARCGRDLARRAIEFLLDIGALGIFQFGVFQSLGET